MWYKKLWVKKLRNRAILLLCIGIIILLMYRNSIHHRKVVLEYSPVKAEQFMKNISMNKGAPKTETMEYGGTTWFKMADQSLGSLWMDPQIGQIAVKLKSGEIWLSNPSKEDQAKDKTKGQWKNNETSPFLINYYDKDNQTEATVNVVDSKAIIDWRPIHHGVGIRYTMVKLGIALYMEYTLDDQGFIVHVPKEGVRESGNHQIVNFSALPFFGANSDQKDGYLFVPDGPGGLIEFGKPKVDLTAPYDNPVYGGDEAVPSDWQFLRTDIAYPVFGMKRGEQGFLSIIEESEEKANIVAIPALMKTDFNNIYAKFKWRNYYPQQKGLNVDNTTNVYEKDLNVSSTTIRYLFLDRGTADYVGMAKRYRAYLIEKDGLKTQKQSEDPPVLLDFVLAASEQPTPFGSKVIVVTKFAEVKSIVDDLYHSGVHEMRVGLRGWQHGGFPGTIPKRFPMESKLGSEQDFKELQSDLQEKHIALSLEDDLREGIDTIGNGFSYKSDAIRQISGKVLKNYLGGDFFSQQLYYYLINPELMVHRYLPKAIEQWKKMSIQGVAQFDENGGDGLYSDYNADHYTDRKKSSEFFVQMYDEIHKQLGWTATNQAYAYLIGHVNHMFNFPVEYNYDLIVNEQVPFYPIVLHGLVSYSSNAGNLRTDPQTQFLRDIEYGALPNYALTNDDVRGLRRTIYSGLVSGQYKLLKPQILAEYQAFKETGSGVWNQLIEGHRKVANGVYETIYGNGVSVVVNYNDQPYSGSDYEVKGMSYLVRKGGGLN